MDYDTSMCLAETIANAIQGGTVTLPLIQYEQLKSTEKDYDIISKAIKDMVGIDYENNRAYIFDNLLRQFICEHYLDYVGGIDYDDMEIEIVEMVYELDSPTKKEADNA